ncbi:sacsin N-terminal ATP-binding-like domain-containing protein [Bacillus sp. B1-b2]|uniref:sacsin N-terminal ATP-binding-like domain-containing protein n=1 Tax=Bacillus sp. B1-b2 TaxID=2653201 RepID=UPI001262A0D1|nr:DUF3883 domain-containing protein [Bacillus sp. B1-b2]KAB7672557.1 DUF3883 domain-containing protein [Bacillus sp. B1-b2]
METVLNNKKKVIAQKTINEIRTFLSELLNGTRNYESMYNLTEQMTHDYSNRFIIELLQNAYDAISSDTSSQIGKIKIILNENENGPSTLYFANTGVPFSQSNFESLSSLALSNKDPKEAIGNKGIGFKSVLQVSNSPKIYSGEWQDKGFSGYCFEFNPEKVKNLTQIIVDLYEGMEIPSFYNLYQINLPLVEWDSSTLKAFKTKLMNQSETPEEFIKYTVNRLSPYQLPFPIDEQQDELLYQLGEEGYVSVVKLKLNEPDALINTKNALSELNPDSIIFLDHLSELTIVHRGDYSDEDLSRHLIQTTSRTNYNNLQINNKEIHDLLTNNQYKYITFSRSIGGENDKSKELQILKASNQLHGKWESVGEAKIDIAVPLTNNQQKGKMYIFLPTKQQSGLAFHINAPFFGQMNRKDIDFSLPLNELYIKETAHVLFDSIKYLVQTKLENCENIIIDLLSFNSDFTDMTSILFESFKNVLIENSLSFSEWGILPYKTRNEDLCFGPLTKVYLLNPDWDYIIFSKENLVKYLSTKFISTLSRDRIKSINQLAKLWKYHMEPNDTDKANWAEGMAQYLHSINAPIEQWQLFYEELPSFVIDSEELVDKYIILGQDRQIHAVPNTENESYVFFPPTQSKGEADEGEDEIVSTINVPNFLSNKIAYFNTEIQLYTNENGRRVRSKFYNYLRDIIEEFSIENIIEKVILPEMPNGTIPLGSIKSNELYELLEWSLSLFYGARNKPESLRESFKELFVPCKDGWIQADQSYFSKTWDKASFINHGQLITELFNNPKNGRILNGYNKLVIDFLDLDSRIQAYGIDKLSEFLLFCGVVDHLHLVPAVPEGKLTIAGVNRSFHFPDKIDGDLLQEQIQIYRDYFDDFRGGYVGPFQYEIVNLLTIEGFDRYHDLTEEGKKLFSKLVIISISKWSDWQTCRIRKPEGTYWWKDIPSLIKLSLQEIPWIPNTIESEISFNTPKKMWYVPSSSLRSAAYTYAFLPYVEYETARLLESANSLNDLQEIGLGNYEISSVSEGCQLLEHLAYSLRNGIVSSELTNYFKHHYRFAWEKIVKYYEDNDFNPNNVYKPRYLVITKGGYLQTVDIENQQSPIYIPDHKKLFLQLHGNPNLEILLIDAGKRYAQILSEIFGDTLTNLSDLEQSFYENGHKWSRIKAENLESSLLDENRNWLLPYIMTIAAYREDSHLTVGGNRFNELISLLKSAKWYECTDLLVSLESKDGKIIEQNSENITVCKETKTFLISNKGFSSLEDFATSVREYLEIAPIELPLKFALSKLTNDFDVEPEEADIISSLEHIKITKENYETIRRLVNDNLQWIIELITPAIVAINKEPDKSVLHFPIIDSENTLKQYISQFIPEPVVIDELIKFAKESRNLKEMGYKLYKSFNVSLKEWNFAIGVVNKNLLKIKNEELRNGFSNFKETYQTIVFAIIRDQVNKQAVSLTDYIDIKEAYQKWCMPDDWEFVWWVIHEDTFLEELGYFLKEHSLDLNAELSSKDALNQYVKEENIDLTPSLEISRHNNLLIKKCLHEIQRAAIALCQNENTEIPSYWLQTEQTFLEHIKSNRDKEYLEIKNWENDEAYIYVFESEKFINAFQELQEIHVNIDSYHDLLKHLENEGNNETTIDEIIEKEKEKKRREKRLVKINGQYFDTDDSNIDNLNDVISRFDFDQMNINGSIDKPLSLKEVTKKNGKNRNPLAGSKGNGKTKRTSKHIENVIGLAGELVIFNYLKKNNLKDFRPEWWKSENSLTIYSDNMVSDSLGYDFEIRQSNKTYHIEVKATVGNDFSFNMGTSETQKAFDDSKKRNVEYMIAFITNVFENPEIYWLPNPYSNKGKSVFNIKDAGVRISFNL